MAVNCGKRGGEENRMRGGVREGEAGRRKIMVREKKKVDRIKLYEGEEKRGRRGIELRGKGDRKGKKKKGEKYLFHTPICPRLKDGQCGKYREYTRKIKISLGIPKNPLSHALVRE